MSKKLTKNELEKYSALNIRYRQIREQITDTTLKLHQLNSMYPAVAGELNNFNNELVDKYGEGRINTETGEVIPNLELEPDANS